MHYPTNYLGVDLGHIRKYLSFRQLGGRSPQLGPLWILSAEFDRQCQLSAYIWLRYDGESKSKGKINLTALIEVTVSNVTYHFST